MWSDPEQPPMLVVGGTDGAINLDEQSETASFYHPRAPHSFPIIAFNIMTMIKCSEWFIYEC
jgi:hypothetical protein